MYLILILENMEPPCRIPGVLPKYYTCDKYYSEQIFRMHVVASSEWQVVVWNTTCYSALQFYPHWTKYSSEIY